MIGDERILTNCKDLSIEPLGDKWKLSWDKNTIIAEQVLQLVLLMPYLIC